MKITFAVSTVVQLNWMKYHIPTRQLLVLAAATSLFAQQRSFTEYSLPLEPGVPPDPSALVTGSDGNVWFTYYQGNRVGKITPAGNVTTFAIPSGPAYPGPITLGPDGNLWFVESLGNKIGRVTVAGAITEYSLPTAGGTPWSIVAGPDGNLWFTEHASFANRIGRITPAGAITEFRVPTPSSNPFGIALGPDGNVWFTESNTGKIGKISPSGNITEFDLPNKSSAPQWITTGPDGNLWFNEYARMSVGTITPAGVIAEFPVNATINGLVTVKDSVWFTDSANNEIGQISASKVIAEFPVPTANGNPAGIAVGPDGNVWFTELTRGKIGILSGASAGGAAPSISAVTNASGGAPEIAPNTWITVWGSNLTPGGDSRTWQQSDFVAGLMPTLLNGVGVTVNGENAYVYYISGNQLDVLTPVAIAGGPGSVQVTNNGVSSGAFLTPQSQYSPSFFLYNGGGPYVTAVHADGSLIGPPDLFPGLSTPAKPGETILAFGNGFGPVPGPYTPGSPIQSGSPAVTPVITIGGISTKIQFAGLISAGLFQFNVVVPLSTPDGDNPITAKTGPFNSLTTQSGTLITVRQ
jgi:uncharacterized protein (TIGR03437 family)